jgi:hypothetical protein
LPKSKPHARRGADAAFARAMARSEFGRFYCDQRDLEEVSRSLTRAKTRVETPQLAHPETGTKQAHAKSAPKDGLWHPIGVRERRTELQAALARLKKARKPPS